MIYPKTQNRPILTKMSMSNIRPMRYNIAPKQNVATKIVAIIFAIIPQAPC